MPVDNSRWRWSHWAWAIFAAGTLTVSVGLHQTSEFTSGPVSGYADTQLQVTPCAATGSWAPGQRWSLAPSNGSAFKLSFEPVFGGSPRCATVDQVFIPGVNTTALNRFCAPGPDSTGSAQFFEWTADGQGLHNVIYSQQCLSLAMDSALPGTQVWLANCTVGAASQSWTFNASSQQLESLGAPGMCLDASTYWQPCSQEPWKSGADFCNTSLFVNDRVADLLARMTPHEKFQQLQNNAAGAASVGLAPFTTADFTHSVTQVPTNTWDVFSAGGTVVYPAASTTAASFNATLFREIGARVGDEARALYNTGFGVLIGWSPNINIYRDPRWGRANEVSGEDPTLGGIYARELVAGQQGADDATGYLKTVAVCKHLVGYSLELWNGTIRYEFNAIIPERDLVGTYLVPFQYCVEEGKAAGLMCSYNAINGTPSCANGVVMNEIVRDTWGFDGHITSDCGASKAVWQTYGYVSTPEAVCPATLNAGMDMGCDNDMLPLQCAALAVADGTLSMAAVDAAVGRIMRVRMRTGEFDPPARVPYAALSNDSLSCAPEGFALAQAAAEQGLVLLKVDRALLPLRNGTIHSVAVVGPNANATMMLNGDYAGWPCHGIVPSVADAFEAAGIPTAFVFGCAVNGSDASGIAAAVAAAQEADVTVVVGGLDLSVEREGLDRYTIQLPGQQPALVSQACAAAAARHAPCVFVVVGAGSVDLSAQLADPHVSAIVWASYPGIRGAAAIVRALFGEAVPAGRLTKTLYPAVYVDQVSMFEFSMAPGPSAWPPFTSPGRTHRFYTGTPVLPFGFGLSYTTFAYAVASGPAAVSLAPSRAFLAAASARHTVHGSRYPPVAAPGVAPYSVNVTNTGSIDADDVVLGFLVPPGAGTDGIPLQELFGFQRVHVRAGQTVTVRLGLSARDLTRVHNDGSRAAWPGAYTVRFGVPQTAALGQGFAEVALLAE